ncbi:F0F1 ATP synthase subunit B [Kineothrix sp. MB12-C1]|uniref:F0F1 ATP synthase subunit B n=1 Tax=Kineothrix sp. MB12-C1 TaxID=3070215 RepID=UPI0027D2A46B|nr:F0F1 ATP synthase subunit B [Kineothrix sp. MB12-C1]WMC93980.1 F0F1 ATP synthase subunit B [Kineothrix sp. MB12-C1]
MLNINFWNIVFTIINVLVLYGLMKKFLVKPVMGIIEKRKQLIQGQLEDAGMEQKKALELKQQYEMKMNRADQEAGEIILQARQQVIGERNQVLEDAREQCARIMERTQANIELQQEKARREAESQIAELALLAARKILKSGEANDANS